MSEQSDWEARPDWQAHYRNPAADALAEAWASIDGHLEQYRRERDGRIQLGHPECEGRYEVYLEEAHEMIARLRTRGFDVVARPATTPDCPESGRAG
jgi:hypothetical protein